MKKTVEKNIEHRKWEVVYEDDYTISIWKYDTKKNSATNPYEVEVKYKKEPVTETTKKKVVTKRGPVKNTKNKK
jgi:hypothetical protein